MDSSLPPKTRVSSKVHFIAYSIFALITIGIFIYTIISPPVENRSFSNNQPVIIHVSEGEGVSTIITELKTKNIIKKSWVAKSLLSILRSDTQIPRGDYLFDHPTTAFNIAWRLARGIHHIEPFKITFREGITNAEIAKQLSEKLPSFRKDLFYSNAKTREGYLFPDTYFFFPLTTTDEVISQLSLNFTRRLSKYKKDISVSGHTEEEVIIMASLIEKEAQGINDRAIIAGILWNRIEHGMLLQVDAAKETYYRKGLPSKPIANPGELAIEASVHPLETAYVFYLHGKDNLPHYAKTYREHQTNIRNYLK